MSDGNDAKTKVSVDNSINTKRPLHDKKVYRHLTLGNGLECLVISAKEDDGMHVRRSNRAPTLLLGFDIDFEEGQSPRSSIRSASVLDQLGELENLASPLLQAQMDATENKRKSKRPSRVPQVPRIHKPSLVPYNVQMGGDVMQRRSTFSRRLSNCNHSVTVHSNHVADNNSSLKPENVSVRSSRRLSTTNMSLHGMLEVEARANDPIAPKRKSGKVEQPVRTGAVQMAAVSMAVGVGSFAESDEFHGMAHFLEHMLFMGSELHPVENAFDSFLARVGGSSNAYTDSERTVYHFTCPQHELVNALDIFAQFFIAPLLKQEAGERELESIEEEFTLRKNDDDCRLLELWRHTSRKETPFSRFTCGNRSTLGANPDKSKVFTKLKEFHNKYYVGSNMRLVVQGYDNVDALQEVVINKFAGVRSPVDSQYVCPMFAESGVPWRIGDAKLVDALIKKSKVWKMITKLDKNLEEPLKPGESGTALGCVFRTIPLQDTHELSMTWQLPPQAANKTSRPTDYITFLLGHEAEGSILAETKARGWTTRLYASACTMDGFEDNSACTMLNLTIVLTRQGLREWVFVAGMVFEYIGMLLVTEPDQKIMEELRSIFKAQYHHGEEVDASSRTQELSVNMLPQWGYEPHNVLDLGLIDDLEWKPELIVDLLYLLQPGLARIDITSTMYKPDAEDEQLPERIKAEYDVLNEPIARSPLKEPYTGMNYWVDRVPDAILRIWRDLYSNKTSVSVTVKRSDKQLLRQMQSQVIDSQPLAMPRPNQFIANDFSNRPQAKVVHPDDSPLFGTNVYVKNGGGYSRKKSDNSAWRRARIVGYDYDDEHRIVLKYEDGLCRWHRLPADFFDKFGRRESDGSKGSKAGKKGKRFKAWRLRTMIRKTREKELILDGQTPMEIRMQGEVFLEGEGDVQGVKKELQAKEKELFPDRKSSVIPAGARSLSSLHVRPDAIGFPYIPKVEDLHLPILVEGSDNLVSVWHLANESFESPRAEIRIRLVNPIANKSPGNAALNDLLAQLVTERLRPQTFQARVAELVVTVESFDFGQEIRVTGFSDKMTSLLPIILDAFSKFAIAGRKMHDKAAMLLESLVSEPVFFAQLEALGLTYYNEGGQFQSSGALSSALYRVIVPASLQPEDKAEAAETIDRKSLAEYAYSLFRKCKVEAMVSGNLNRSDAESILQSIKETLAELGSVPLEQNEYPTYNLLEIPVVKKGHPRDSWRALGGIVHPLEALEFPGHSIDLFFLVGEDKAENRVMLNLIEHIMREPLYAELRTKQQLGYVVKCSTVALYGQLGYVIELTSGKYGPQYLALDVDAFLIKFRQKLRELPREVFDDHVCALARKKLDRFGGLDQTAARHWETIKGAVYDNGSYHWNAHIEESQLLLSKITPAKLLRVYDQWLSPASEWRQRVSVIVFGHGHDGDPLKELQSRKDYITFVGGDEPPAELEKRKGCVIS